MKAAVLHQFGAPLRLEERSAPGGTGEEVLVAVQAAGVCHTDLHIIDGHFPDLALPRVLGHEIAGDAEGIGPVLVYGSWGCGICEWCRRGEENLCAQAADPGWRRDGGYAEYVIVPSSRYLLPLRGLDPLQAAPLADAGVTAYRAVRRAIPWLADRSSAVVIGAGGVGQFAIQYLKILTSAQVIVVEPSARRRQRAIELGADRAVATGDGLTGGAQAVFDLWGSDATLELAVGIVSRAGIVVQVGENGGRVYFGMGMLPPEVALTTSIWGSYRDLRAVLDLARSGLLRWDVEPVPLDQVNQALGRLRSGQVTGRLVLTP